MLQLRKGIRNCQQVAMQNLAPREQAAVSLHPLTTAEHGSCSAATTRPTLSQLQSLESVKGRVGTRKSF